MNRQRYSPHNLFTDSFTTISAVVLILMILYPVQQLKAQKTATIDASANVLFGVVVEGIQALDFNNVLRGMTKTVNAEDAAVSVSGGVNPGANEEQAVFAVLAEDGTNMTLELQFPSTVERTDADPIPISFTKEGGGNNFLWATAVNIGELATATRNEFNAIDNSGDSPVATAVISKPIHRCMKKLFRKTTTKLS